MNLSSQAADELKYAKTLLESPGLAVKLTGLIGGPIEKGVAILPSRLTGWLQKASMIAIRSALRFALLTLSEQERNPSNRWHKGLAAASGGIGGAFGMPALVAELPVSTIIMLRSIADIARSEGERMALLETRLACLEVFAFGGRTKRDDAADTGYFAVRAALAQAVSEAAKHIAEKGAVDKGAPAVVRLITQVAARFNVVVSQKAAGQAVPIIGAVSGMAVNTLFIDHFQKMARGHFIIRRLERTFGAATIREAYDAIELDPAVA